MVRPRPPAAHRAGGDKAQDCARKADRNQRKQATLHEAHPEVDRADRIRHLRHGERRYEGDEGTADQSKNVPCQV